MLAAPNSTGIRWKEEERRNWIHETRKKIVVLNNTGGKIKPLRTGPYLPAFSPFSRENENGRLPRRWSGACIPVPSRIHCYPTSIIINRKLASRFWIFGSFSKDFRQSVARWSERNGLLGIRRMCTTHPLIRLDVINRCKLRNEHSDAAASWSPRIILRERRNKFN